MDCLKTQCKYYSPEESERHTCDFCTISGACILGGCPVERMIRYAQDRLEGLKSVLQYLATLK